MVHPTPDRGERPVEYNEAIDQARETKRHVLDDRGPEIAPRRHHLLEAEPLAQQRSHVQAMSNNVVKTVRANIRIAETSQIGNYNVETTTRELAHIAQPDAPGRRPPVDQQQRDASTPLPPVRQIASADTGALG
jgi:hypothetical protein